MQEELGLAITSFYRALEAFRTELVHPDVAQAVFAGTQDWVDLLTYKLVPHLEGEGCLVVAVAGGTNTGKSTAFNMLCGADISPMRNTAAATCRPVLAGNARRYAQCLESKLVPEFKPAPLKNAEAVVRRETPEDAIFVVKNESLPDHVVILDTPDIDSIDQQNWEVAENIRAAGDVLVAVLTGEKYKDERVVQFFRQAHAAGRIIVPLMNKANPENDFEVARGQLAEFCKDIGLSNPPRFAIAHDFSIAKNLGAQTIQPLDGTSPLREYLESLDVKGIKEAVYGNTVRHVIEQAGSVVETAEAVHGELRRVVKDFEARAHTTAQQYLPSPSSEVGGLFHEFIQSKRGGFDRAVGSASRGVARGIGKVGTAIRRSVLASTSLEAAEQPTDADVDRVHARKLRQLTQELQTGYYQTAENLRPPTDKLITFDLKVLDGEAVATAVSKQTLKAENISEEYRQYANRMLEKWWDENKMRRQGLMMLDRILLIAPGAIAGVMAIHTAGVGVAETMVVAGPLTEQFAARAFEYQFGDRLFGFVQPWQKEQQAAFEQALLSELTHPALRSVRALLEPFEGESFANVKHWLEQCQKAL